MDASVKQKIIDILDQNRIMSLATLRPDGWPQATTVGFAHEGLTLYFLCGRDSQKTRNLEKDDRVSLTINADVPHVMGITGVSMAARAESIKDPGEAQRILGSKGGIWTGHDGQTGAIGIGQEMRAVNPVPVDRGLGHAG